MSAAFIFSALVIGLLLMLVEVILVPGFGVPGILGLGALGAGAAGAWVAYGPVWGSIAAVTSALLTGVLVYVAPHTRAGKRMVLSDRTEGHADRGGDSAMLGREGETVTPLRPVGVARFGGEELDVTAASGHVEAGRRVRVTEVDGMRVLVEQVAGEEPR